MTPTTKKRIARVTAALKTIQAKNERSAALKKASAARAVAARKASARTSAKPVPRKPVARAAAPAPKRPVAASAPARRPGNVVAKPVRRALREEPAAAPKLDKVAPILNNVDSKTQALDKMISGLLSAINNNNTRNTTTLMQSVIKKLRELGAEGDRLEPLTASARRRKASISQVQARGRLAVARARKALA